MEMSWSMTDAEMENGPGDGGAFIMDVTVFLLPLPPVGCGNHWLVPTLSRSTFANLLVDSVDYDLLLLREDSGFDIGVEPFVISASMRGL
eukprot:12883280-Ditylum_brightwellii.AAC.1